MYGQKSVLVVTVKEPLLRLAPGKPLGGDPFSVTPLLPPPPQAAKANPIGDSVSAFLLFNLILYFFNYG